MAQPLPLGTARYQTGPAEPRPGAALALSTRCWFAWYSRLLNADWRINMPGNHHLRGVSDKEQRQYEHIKESAEKSGRYGGRAKEVAARTVMKEHKQNGHKKGS